MSPRFAKDFLARYGADPAAAEARLADAHARLVRALEALPEASLQAPRAPEAWSPAEVADHVIRAEAGFVSALERAAAGEPPWALAVAVRADGRPVAPAGFEPRRGRKLDALRSDLEAGLTRARDVAAAVETTGAWARPALDHGLLGPLDAFEVLQLAAWHVRHHTRQIVRP